MKVYTKLLPAMTLLFSACTQNVPEMPPKQVLERTINTHQQLESVQVDAEIQLHSERTNAQVEIDGVMHGKRKAFQLEATVDLQPVAGTEGIRMRGSLEMLKDIDGTMYIQLEDIEGVNDVPFATMLPVLKGQWWRIPAGSDYAETTITPDPYAIERQLSSIDIVRSYGIVNEDSKRMYKYDVALNKKAWANSMAEEDVSDAEAIESATGTIFIDAEEFVLHKADWAVVLTEGSVQTVEAHIVLTNHGAQVDIVPPQESSILDMTQFLAPLPIPPAL